MVARIGIMRSCLHNGEFHVDRLDTLHDLLVSELRSLYSAGQQASREWRWLIDGANDEGVVHVLERQHEALALHLHRLEEAFEELQVSPHGPQCIGMHGLLEEARDTVRRVGDEDVLDATVVSAAQRIALYFAASYAGANAHARALGMRRVAYVLERSLRDHEADVRRLASQAQLGLDMITADDVLDAAG